MLTADYAVVELAITCCPGYESGNAHTCLISKNADFGLLSTHRHLKKYYHLLNRNPL